MAKRIIGFNVSQNDGQEEKKGKEAAPYVKVLDAYFAGNRDSGRWTSQDIADNLRETMNISVGQVFRYMTEHGYRLERDDDRMVWVID